MNLDQTQRKLAGLKNFAGAQNDLQQAGIAQINLTITKVGADPATFAEIFCSGASAADVRVPEYGATYTAAYDFATGNLVLTYAVGQTVTIGCSDNPYRWLMKTMESNSFQTSLIRMTVSSTAQYGFKLKPFRRSAFGATGGNNINPNAYRDPQNQQANIIDINSKVAFDNEHGLSFELAAVASTVDLSLFIPVYAKPNTAEAQLGI